MHVIAMVKHLVADIFVERSCDRTRRQGALDKDIVHLQHVEGVIVIPMMDTAHAHCDKFQGDEVEQ